MMIANTQMQVPLRVAPPSNIEAEQAVLGAVLCDGEAFVRVLPVLKSDAFYLDKHGWIYEAMGALYARHEPLDYLTVCSELDRRGKLNDVGGSAYLVALGNAVPTTYNVEQYAALVDRARLYRETIRAAGAISEIGYAAELEPDEVISRMGEIVTGVRGGRRVQFRTAYAVGMDMEQRIQERFANPGMVWGVPTGLKRLDKAMGGMESTNLIIVGAPPGAGKSALAEQIAVNVAGTGQGVAYFSLEMSAQEHLQRMVGIKHGFDTREIRQGLRADGTRRWTDDEQLDYFRAHADIETLPIYFNDAAGITTTEACAAATELAMTKDVALVIFDYLQLAGTDGKRRHDNRTAEVGQISRGLKAMAKTLRVPVLALAQINRAVSQREDKRPQLWDLRESGDIEADADVVIFIYRAGYYYKTREEWEARYPRLPYPENEAELILAKGRNLQLGYVKQVWDAPHTRFMELEYGA